MRRAKFEIALLSVAAVQFAALGGYLLWADRPPAGAFATPFTTEQIVGQDPHVLGSYRAPFTLVEFGDYECPPCAAAAPVVKKEVAALKGEVRFVFRNNPLPIHPLSTKAAVIAEAAGSLGAFWEEHDRLYAFDADVNEADLKREDSRLRISPAVAEAGAKRVLTDASAAKSFGIDYTPAFFLCLPNGTVERLGSIYSLADVVAGAAH